MSCTYIEQKINRRSVFTKQILDKDGKIISERQISLPLFQVEKDGFIYFVLYDDRMDVIKEFYEYLNFQMAKSPITSRRQSAFALRLLYCFLALSGDNINKLNDSVLDELIAFLRGVSSSDLNNLTKTVRSANTINGYLSVYRSFFANQHIHSEALFRSLTTRVSMSFDGNSQFDTERKKYTSNLKTPSPDYTVPKYISPAEFQILYKLVQENNDKETGLIIHLMYGYGLRLGEVLGMTVEDISEIQQNLQTIPVIYLRNRTTDKRFQFAKGLPHVIDTREYKTSDYIKSKSKVEITYDVFEQLYEYIDEVHQKAKDKYPKNYATGNADIVSTRNKPEWNHYVFLNRYGKVLSDETFNNHLKQYFIKAGISIDSGYRENNLAHRFRHGFAMFHAKYSEHPVDALKLQKMMRHKSINSTMVYYNPTPEDELQIKTEFQKELYSLIPELKEGWNDKDTTTE